MPRVRLVPRAAANDVEDAAFLGQSYGLVPDDWQETVLEGWLGIRSDGMWAAPRCGLAVPRQNGKNALLEIRELHGMVTLGERWLHTAHEVKTARKAFIRLASFFENTRQYPELAALVKEIRRTNGQEAIVLTNGGSVEFVARSKGSARGYSVDGLALDEAQELGEEAYAALRPTISASPNPQEILTGTPPGPTANGEIFTRFREEGSVGGSRRLCWMEWSCVGDVDLDDHAAWAQANPALGIRLRYDTTQDERAALDDETFARERLGMWETKASRAVIDPRAWYACADTEGVIDPSRVAFAVDVPPDRSTASISIAGLRPDGLPQVEVLQSERGVSWVVERIAGLVEKWSPCAVVLDASGPAGSLLADLEQRGIETVNTSAREMGQACGAFYDAATDLRLRHRDDPRLNAAVGAARKRALGDAWAWHRKDVTTDISPLVAATLALWGFSQAPAASKRTGKVW